MGEITTIRTNNGDQHRATGERYVVRDFYFTSPFEIVADIYDAADDKKLAGVFNARQFLSYCYYLHGKIIDPADKETIIQYLELYCSEYLINQ